MTKEQALAMAAARMRLQNRQRAEQQVAGDPITQGAQAGARGFPSVESEQAAQGITDRVRGDINPIPGSWGTGTPQAAYDVGGKVTDVASNLGASPRVAGAAGYGTNVLTQAIPALLAGGKIQGAPAQHSLAGPLSRRLMQSSVKPSMAARKSGDAARAMGDMLEEGIYPTTGGMDKASRIAGKMDDLVEGALAQSTERVGVARVGSRLRKPYEAARSQVNPEADMAAVREAWQEFVKSPSVRGQSSIPVQLAHALKKGTYKSLGKKTYGEIKTPSIESQKALARGLREEVADKVPGVVEPLKREASMMNIKGVAGDRAILEANKDPMGLAALRMDNPLSAATFWANRTAAIKAALAEALYKGTQPRFLAAEGLTGTQAVNQRE